MKAATFWDKAKEFGDFYIYFARPDTQEVTFAVATADLSTPYIRNNSRFKAAKRAVSKGVVPPTSNTCVDLWDWKSDKLICVELASIKKLVPLQSVLKNERPY